MNNKPANITAFEVIVLLSCTASLSGTFLIDSEATRAVLVLGACTVMGACLLTLTVGKLVAKLPRRGH